MLRHLDLLERIAVKGLEGMLVAIDEAVGMGVVVVRVRAERCGDWRRGGGIRRVRSLRRRRTMCGRGLMGVEGPLGLMVQIMLQRHKYFGLCGMFWGVGTGILRPDSWKGHFG